MEKLTNDICSAVVNIITTLCCEHHYLLRNVHYCMCHRYHYSVFTVNHNCL